MDIFIKVKSTTFSRDFGHDKTEFECTGRLEEKNGKKYVRYKEPDTNESVGADVTLKLDDSVTLMRSGETKSHFVFKKDETHISKYLTPYGDFLMKVKAVRVKIVITDEGGEIDLGYKLTINEGEPVSNNFYLTYTIK